MAELTPMKHIVLEWRDEVTKKGCATCKFNGCCRYQQLNTVADCPGPVL